MKAVANSLFSLRFPTFFQRKNRDKSGAPAPHGDAEAPAGIAPPAQSRRAALENKLTFNC
jgi:hypothetical protein